MKTNEELKKIRATRILLIAVFVIAAGISVMTTARSSESPEVKELSVAASPESEITVETLESAADDLAQMDNFKLLYNIPLSEDLQRFTYDRCTELGIPYELVLGVMWQESRYDPTKVSPDGDYGIMQINQSNIDWIMGVCGLTDIMDAKQNIIAGTKMLYYLYGQYDDMNDLLMVYNSSSKSAKKLWSKGIHSSEYSRAILNYVDTLTLADGTEPS